MLNTKKLGQKNIFVTY